MKIKINKITVLPDNFKFDVKIEENNGAKKTKVFYLEFSKRLSWNPYSLIKKIASYMATRKGDERIVKGRYIQVEMFKMNLENEFIIYGNHQNILNE